MSKEEYGYHRPVLLTESIDGLITDPNGIYVDVTFGGGGHSKEILSRLGSEGKLFAFDQDEDALANAIDDPRFTLINQNFRYLKRYLRFYGVNEVDGVLGDLGVSSHQFDVPERGFSTRFDGELDMRMSQAGDISAYNVVNEYAEADLRNMFYMYGELKNAGSLANAIVKARTEEPIKNTDELKLVLARFLPAHKSAKILAQIYQAIRIEVNQEMDVLKEMLMQSLEVLKPEGRLSIISYHSLEDRLVKRFMKNGMFEGEPEKDFYGRFEVPMKQLGKLIIPTDEELAVNNRARSAKLRIAEKKMKNKVNSPGDIIKAKILVNENSAKTWAFIIYIIILSLLLIGNTQSYEAKVFKIAKLTHEVKMLRAEFVDTRSELMELKMESTITKNLEEDGILPSETPATKIKVTEEIKTESIWDKLWR